MLSFHKKLYHLGMSVSKEGEYIYGWQPIWEALNHRPETIDILFLAEDLSSSKKKRLLSLAKEKGVTIKFRPTSYFDSLEKEARHKIVHQGVVGLLKQYKEAHLEDILAQKPTLLLALDHIQDPQNLGNIIRTATAFGVEGIIMPKDRAARVTPTVIKTSAGTALRMPIVQVANLAQTLEMLKENGLWVVGTVTKGEIPVWEISHDLPLVIVVGHEHKGLSRMIKEKCDFLVTIPMQKDIDSLNVASATAICLYEIWRKKVKNA